MAREQANVTTVLVNNDAYAILRLELQRVGHGPHLIEAAVPPLL